jgi:hypothetical protein
MYPCVSNAESQVSCDLAQWRNRAHSAASPLAGSLIAPTPERRADVRSQLLYIINNGTTSSGARDDSVTPNEVTAGAGGADADDAANLGVSAMSAPGAGAVVGSVLISAFAAMWAGARA